MSWRIACGIRHRYIRRRHHTADTIDADPVRFASAATRTVIDVETRPLLLLLATLVSLLTAGVLTHALKTARSRDSWMGWGWVLAGAVAVGTGLWSAQSLALLGARLGGSQLFSFKGVALAWCVSVAAAAASLFAARGLPTARLRVWASPWILSLLWGVALGATINVLPGTS